MTKKIINYGSINIDYVYRTPHFVRPGETLHAESFTKGLGGKGANQSVAIARSGGHVVHVGQLSTLDRWAKDVLVNAGVLVDFIDEVDDASGHAIIQVDSEGENAILLHGGANQSVDIKSLEKAMEETDDVEYLLLQNECNNSELAINAALSNKIKVAFNPAPMSQDVASLNLEQLDTLIVNELEAQALTGSRNINDSISFFVTRLPATRVVMTLGAKGSILVNGGNVVEFPSTSVDVIDTTGAGDTFVGYFLQSLVSGLDDMSALEIASSAAALAVTERGAINAIPNIERVTEFIHG